MSFMDSRTLWKAAAESAWTTGCLAGWGLFALALLVAGVSTYRLFLHPLAQVPGPRLAALSNAWYAHHVRHGRAAELGRRLHAEYGRAVRVGPNEVWYNSREAFDVIYNTTKGFEKTDFYLATNLIIRRIDWRLRPHFEDSLDLLSERDSKRYRLQRRLIGRVYQAANVSRHEKAIDELLASVVERLEALQGAEIDLKEWMHILAVECLGASVLSWSPGLLRDGTDWSASSHSYLGWRRKSVLGLFPTMAKLGRCSQWFDWLFRDMWGLTFTSPSNFKSFFPDVGKQVNRRINVILKSTAKTKPNGRKRSGEPGKALAPTPPSDLLDDLIQLHRDRPEFTETYLRKMAMTNFGAGHDTMASTLTAVFALIGSHPEAQRRVAAEVCSSSSSETARHLRYTRAAIKEAMRLHPVLTMSLPRLAPPGGVFLEGRFVPAGTTVGCNPVALHRNRDVVGADPDLYRPERWLDGDAQRVRGMERYSLSWGGGGRTCPGRNLAEMVLYKVVPGVLARFEVEVTRMPAEGEMPSYFLSMMTGVRARFLPRSADSKIER